MKKREMGTWSQMTGSMHLNHLLREPDGQVIAVLTRMKADSLMYVYLVHKSDPPLENCLVAPDITYARETVEHLLVRAGICPPRVLA
jgi:hypothetical protein